MNQRIAVLAVFLLASFAGPNLFAQFCQDCPDGLNCVTQNGGAHFCEFFQDGSCKGIGTCRTGASLQAEYRVAAVHVIEPAAKPLPQPQTQPNATPVLAAAK